MVLLAGLLPRVWSDTFQTSPGPPSQGDTAHSEMGHYISIINQENVLQIRLQAGQMETFSLLMFPFPGDPSLGQVDEKN